MGNAGTIVDNDHNTALVQRYLASFSSGDPETVAEHVHPDFQNNHLGVLGEPCEGRETYKERLSVFLAQFQNIKYVTLGLLVQDNFAACRYIMTFKNEGRAYEIFGMMWFDFSEGLIFRRVDCWDGLDFLKKSDADAELIQTFLQ